MATSTPRTLAELAAEAIQIQDASNLSGLVHGWSRAVGELRLLMPSAGTDTINRHPINKMWAFKLYSLACYEPLDDKAGVAFGDAYDHCKNMMAAGK